MYTSSWRFAAYAMLVVALVCVGTPTIAKAQTAPAPPGAQAQSAPAPPAAAAPAGNAISLWGTIKGGGIIGFLIILMSLISGAFVIEHFMSIRRDRLVPSGIAEDLEKHIQAKNYTEAQQLCAEHNSFLARVVGAGLNQIGAMFGFFDMQSAMQEVSEREISKLYRKLEYLGFIAATAPMLGLLGTVTGMIRAFNTIAALEEKVRPSDLASGISEALVTTCLGLVVAIPTMFFVALFRSRIDSFVAEAETVVEKLMAPFRKGTE